MPRFAFAGMVYDPATGMSYDNARYYDPGTGRFINQDPLGFGGGTSNIYEYSDNNPTTLNDPTGLEPRLTGGTGSSGISTRGSAASSAGQPPLDNFSNYLFNSAMASIPSSAESPYLSFNTGLSAAEKASIQSQLASGSGLTASDYIDVAGSSIVGAAQGVKNDAVGIRDAGTQFYLSLKDTGNSFSAVVFGHQFYNGNQSQLGIASLRSDFDIGGNIDRTAANLLTAGIVGQLDTTSQYFNGKIDANTFAQQIGTTGAFQVFGGLLGRTAGARTLVENTIAVEELNDVPVTTFRGDRSSVMPENVFANGIKSKGENLDLLRHASRNQIDSGYVGTSIRFNIAQGFAGRNGYIYEVVPEGGIDVNATLGSRSPFPEQAEIAIPGRIDPTNIRGAYPLTSGKLTGEYIANPSFRW